jgi:iron complex outermembrane receptor protein
MNTLRRGIRRALGSGAVALLAVPAAFAQQDRFELEQIVVTGTRVADRSATDTAVPVDVVTAEALANVGVTELNQALSTALPSLNFPRPGLADGSDTIRPATLRGLAPDQTLVLLNSKRRHMSSLVNVNETIGRGAASVDLNAIPTAAVQAIEVLRDGASAQYGSDAIAGVVNVRLKDMSDGGNATVSYGWRETSYTPDYYANEQLYDGAPGGAGAPWSVPSKKSVGRSDGETMTVSAWKGLTLGSDGFLTLTLEYKDQKRTERDGWDFRQQYPSLAGGSCSVDNAFCDPRELTFDRFNAWYGEPDLKQLTLFANFGTDLAGGAHLYGWAGYQDRDAKSAGFYRRAQDSRNVIAIYPDGFLPIIHPTVTDYSGALGVTWDWGGWAMDTSLVYGYNKMKFRIENTLNASIGPSSQTEFNAGGFDYDQLVFNFSGVRQADVGSLASPVNIAAGIEARTENYSIFAGEETSWQNYDPTKASGAQVFPGFRPANALSEDRSAVGAYLDLEANMTEKLLGSVALRVEHYSDFGSNVSGKLALRYDFSDSFALRGSVQNGFRAPSLQQQYFATTSTNFINGVPFEISTFPATDPVSEALGAKPLDAETSINFSVGAVMQLGPVSLTVDAYRIDIDDRIVLSENLNSAAVQQYLVDQGFIGIGGARFFINGVNTETKGVDVVANWPIESDGAGRFDLTLAASFNDTKVTKVPETKELEALSPPPVLFARLNVLTFEEGNPGDKLSAAVNWKRDSFGATLRATRYGKALHPQNNPAQDFTLGSKTLVDLEGRFDVTENIRVAIGAENLFDEYPDPFKEGVSNSVVTDPPDVRNTTGNTPFSNYSPFGRSGRFVYGRLSVNF